MSDIQTVLHPKGLSSGPHDRMHPSFWSVLEEMCESLPTPARYIFCLTCTLTTRKGGRQAKRWTSLHCGDQLNITQQYIILLNDWKTVKKKILVLHLWPSKKKKNLTRNYALCRSGNARGGSAQITAFHFPRLWTACLQIRAAKRESQIGIPILLRSHAQQQKMPNGPSAMGKKEHYSAEILKHSRSICWR